MSPERLDELERLIGRRTPGGWRVASDRHVESVTGHPITFDTPPYPDDAAAIAAVMTDAYDLIAAARREAALREVLERLDAPFRWLLANYPKAFREMPWELLVAFEAARKVLLPGVPQ